ncbi:MAG: hypothetical protein IH940_12655, partial [Acidobacteria bacterium]|nr:hypothetical protein [Acidobacteriota bacterium]
MLRSLVFRLIVLCVAAMALSAALSPVSNAAAPSSGGEPGSYVAPPPSGEYVPLSPVRLLDTRNTGAVGPQSRIDVKVTGVAGVPAGATAVVLNITATQATAESFVTVWPNGAPRPTASNLNTSNALPTTANLVIAKVGADGKVSLYNHAGNVHLIADIAGFYQPDSGYVPRSPARLLDTRNTSPVGPQSSIDLKVTGVAGVPENATAVVLNVTATQPTAESFITVWPKGTARPNASNLNTSTALPTTANLVIAKVGAEGKV